jgi:hypothetical protein
MNLMREMELRRDDLSRWEDDGGRAAWTRVLTRFVQPDPATGYRFTAYEMRGNHPWCLVERGFIYHRLDLSDLGEPYLTAVKESLQRDATPKPEDIP